MNYKAKKVIGAVLTFEGLYPLNYYSEIIQSGGVYHMEGIRYGIAWQESYRIDENKVDGQHRQLFELLSRLICSCVDGSNADKLKETLDFLVNYTVQHFYDEESLQVQYNYPGYSAHKQLHEDFKATVSEIVQKYNEEGSSTELRNSMNKIVARWLVNHITREDKKIGDHIRMMERRHLPSLSTWA